MKRYFIIIATAMAVLMYASPVAAADRYERIKSIGILCGISDTLLLDGQGFHRLRLPALRACDHLVAWATHALSPRFEIKPVAYSAEEVERCRDSCAYAVPSNGNVDAYVVIHPMWQPVGNWLVAGLGLSHSRVILMGHSTSIHAHFRVGVYDAKTYKQINGGMARVPVPDLFGALPAVVEFDEANWIDSAADVTPARTAAITAGMTRLLRIALAMALSGADLMPRPQYGSSKHVVAMVAGTEPVPYFADVPGPPPPQSQPAADPAARRTPGAANESASPAHQSHSEPPGSATEPGAPSHLQGKDEPQ